MFIKDGLLEKFHFVEDQSREHSNHQDDQHCLRNDFLMTQIKLSFDGKLFLLLKLLFKTYDFIESGFSVILHIIRWLFFNHKGTRFDHYAL